MTLNILCSQSSQTVKALEEEALSIVTHVISYFRSVFHQFCTTMFTYVTVCIEGYDYFLGKKQYCYFLKQSNYPPNRMFLGHTDFKIRSPLLDIYTLGLLYLLDGLIFHHHVMFLFIPTNINCFEAFFSLIYIHSNFLLLRIFMVYLPSIFLLLTCLHLYTESRFIIDIHS